MVYKALDNLGAFRRWFGMQPDTKGARCWIFGLFHGFGLATKLQDFELSPDGLVANIVAFNVGVEIGQMLALGAILIAMGWWRRTAGFRRYAYTANVVMMAAGFVLRRHASDRLLRRRTMEFRDVPYASLPAIEDLASAGELRRSTLISAGCSAPTLLVTVLLPAEYAERPDADRPRAGSLADGRDQAPAGSRRTPPTPRAWPASAPSSSA